tara:strand:- start:164 stop:478 length:315 start_codon:yes stop_codon:yes gene_type:complete
MEGSQGPRPELPEAIFMFLGVLADVFIRLFVVCLLQFVRVRIRIVANDIWNKLSSTFFILIRIILSSYNWSSRVILAAYFIVSLPTVFLLLRSEEAKIKASQSS